MADANGSRGSRLVRYFRTSGARARPCFAGAGLGGPKEPNKVSIVVVCQNHMAHHHQGTSQACTSGCWRRCTEGKITPHFRETCIIASMLFFSHGPSRKRLRPDRRIGHWAGRVGHWRAPHSLCKCCFGSRRVNRSGWLKMYSAPVTEIRCTFRFGFSGGTVGPSPWRTVDEDDTHTSSARVQSSTHGRGRGPRPARR